jgi:hypothetical protein
LSANQPTTGLRLVATRRTSRRRPGSSPR